MSPPVYVDGRVRVRAWECSTCVFRKGNLMHLHAGRLKGMVEQAVANESTIVCHQTLSEEKGAVCRGFYERHQTQPLQVAGRLDMVEEVP